MRTIADQKLIRTYANWIQDRADAQLWTSFAITCVFKSQSRPNEDRWIDEYKHKVLWKINKRLSRRAEHLEFYEDCYYEYDHKSLLKSLADTRSPHHIHGLVCIDPEDVYKVWNAEENCINQHLQDSFDSIRTVQSVLLEPMNLEKAEHWIRYMAKGKTLH